MAGAPGEICQAEVTQTWVRGQAVHSQG